MVEEKKKRVQKVQGSWELKYTLPDGEKIWRFRRDYRGFHLPKTGTIEECNTFANARVREIDAGARDMKKPVFKTRWKKFIDSMKNKGKPRLVTIEEYDATIKRYFYPKFKFYDIRHITYSMLNDFFADFETLERENSKLKKLALPETIVLRIRRHKPLVT